MRSTLIGLALVILAGCCEPRVNVTLPPRRTIKMPCVDVKTNPPRKVGSERNRMKRRFA